MGKLLSVCVASALMCIAPTAFAADVVTADTVMEKLFASGLPSSEAENYTVTDSENAAKSGAAEVFIGENNSVRVCRLSDDPTYYETFGEYEDFDILKYLDYLGDDELEYLIVSDTGDNIGVLDLNRDGDCLYYGVTDDAIPSQFNFWHSADPYADIAEIINDSDIGTPQEIRLFRADLHNAVYIKTASADYIISAEDMTDNNAGYLGKESATVSAKTLIPAKEYYDFLTACSANKAEAFNALLEKMNAIDSGGLFLKAGEETPARPATDNRSAFTDADAAYSDISADTLLNTCISELTARGVINGFDDGTFRPSADITRAEAAAMFWRLLGGEAEQTADFSDVPQTAWYFEAVGTLSAKGLINGYDDGTFRPNDTVTYQEMLRIALNILGMPDVEYDDVISRSMEIGLTDELDSFASGASVTRGDGAILLSKLLDSYIRTYRAYAAGTAVSFSLGDDLTLSDYIDGVAPSGRYFTSAADLEQYFEAMQEEFTRLYGSLISEYNAARGSSQSGSGSSSSSIRVKE